MGSRYLTPEQAADLLGYKPKTLAEWRYLGRGPRYVKTSPGRSGRIRYAEADVIAWLEANTQGGAAA